MNRLLRPKYTCISTARCCVTRYSPIIRATASDASQHSLLDEHAHTLDYRIVGILVGVVARLQVDTEELAERLPESSTECAEKRFQNRVAALVGFAVYQFYEHLSLGAREFLQHGLVLVEYLLFHARKVILTLLLGGNVSMYS